MTAKKLVITAIVAVAGVCAVSQFRGNKSISMQAERRETLAESIYKGVDPGCIRLKLAEEVRRDAKSVLPPDFVARPVNRFLSDYDDAVRACGDVGPVPTRDQSNCLAAAMDTAMLDMRRLDVSAGKYADYWFTRATYPGRNESSRYHAASVVYGPELKRLFQSAIEQCRRDRYAME